MDIKQTKAEKKKRNVINKLLAAITPIDDYPSRQEWENSCWQKLLNSKELLQLLVTSYEQHNLVGRAAAIAGLASGKSYRQISKDFFLSLQTVSGAKKAVMESNYRSYLERSKKERKRKEFSPSSLVLAKPRHRGRPVRTKYGTLHLPDY